MGIALEIDFGVFDRTKKSINRTVSKSNNNGRNGELSGEEESKVIIPLSGNASLKEQQFQTFSRALRWLWAKSNPANICGYLLIDLDSEIVRP